MRKVTILPKEHKAHRPNPKMNGSSPAVTDTTVDPAQLNDATAKPAPAQMKGHVIRGILLVGIASVVMRGGGLIGQFVAGLVLTEADFGLFAITLGFTTLSVSSLSALRPLFIERLSNEQTDDERQGVDSLWRLVLLAMTTLAVAIMVLAGPIASALNQPDARLVLLAMAPTLPLQFAQVIGIARLAAQLRFAESSRILTIAALTRHGSLVAFALLGFGVYSLVLPLYVEALVQGVLLWRASGAPPKVFGSIRGVFEQHGTTLRWLLLTAVALAASLNGDYLAISPFETVELVGLYFFGYQLSAALTQPFTMAATNVLVPSFAAVTDQAKLRSSYLDAISVLLLATGLAFGGLALVGGALVDFIWSGRWNESIVAMVLISAGTPFRILQPTCYSLLQSLGRWSSHSKMALFNATFAVGSAVIGAILFDGLFPIALLVGIAGGIVGITVAVLAGRIIGISPITTLTRLFRGATPPVAGLAAAFALVPGLLPSTTGTIVRVAVFLIVSLPLTAILFKRALGDIAGSVRKR